VPTVKGGLDPHMINSMEDGTFKLVHYILWICCILLSRFGIYFHLLVTVA
jgi:hypothetical protein